MKKKNDLHDSHKNLRRDLGDITKLSITSESGTGILGECVIANILRIRNCDNCTLTKKNYDWSCPYDLEKDGRKIQVKAKIQWYGQYSFGIGDIHNFDILYIICLNKGMKNIRRIYVIPDIKISDKKGITIYEDSSTGEHGQLMLYLRVWRSNLTQLLLFISRAKGRRKRNLKTNTLTVLYQILISQCRLMYSNQIQKTM